MAYDSNGTMLAAVLHAFDDLRLEQVPRPAATEAGQVVVKVKSCGTCLTDYKAVKGIRKNVEFPSIHGHEISGVLVQTGPNVKHFKVGDHVVVSPLSFCGMCSHCRSNNQHYCQHAAVYGGDGPPDFRSGGWAEFILAEESMLYKKPANISFHAAAVTEPLAGAWKGMVHHTQVQVGDDVIVLGVGGIGLLAMMVAKAAGAGRLIALDPSPHARSHALKQGATHALNPLDGDIEAQISAIIPDGPDVVFESAGKIQAVDMMMKLRRRGTKANVFGITTPETFELEGGKTHWLEGRIDASFGSHPLAFVKALKLIETGLVDPEKIISHKIPLKDIHKAMEIMESPERNKVVIVINDDPEE